MSKRAIKGVRATFRDALREIEARSGPADPEPHLERAGVKPGQWPGAPMGRLPPNCPVVPLGKDGTISYLIDTLGQLTAVDAATWSKKIIIDLFALSPNYPYWAWPRYNAKTLTINGLEADEACACLVNAAARRGLFNPVDRVRGRGGWTDRAGRFIWHSGEHLWTVDGGRLLAAAPGEIDGVFYPRRPPIVTPWEEPVDTDDTPAHQLLADLGSWTLERTALDPVLVLGWLGCAFMGGALPWRPTLFVTGDRGVGKSTLQSVVKGILSDALHATADTTAAGIYQRINQDCLPVAVDELEADADNRKVIAVLKLARLAASGAMMFRGGQDHAGVEFRAMNCFLFGAINPPPLAPQDRSRMAIVNLGRLDKGKTGGSEPRVSEVTGRMLLRQLMQAWPRFRPALDGWRRVLWGAGLDARAQDTYGTLLAVAELLLGPEAMEEAGLPVTDELRIGQAIREATAAERAEQKDNWRGALEHLFGSAIDAWRGGERPMVGAVLEDLRSGELALKFARERLAAAGLGLRDKGQAAPGYALAVPADHPQLAKLYAGTVWGAGVWAPALRQAPPEIVLRFSDSRGLIKIAGQVKRCLFVDLEAYERLCEEGG